MSTPKLTPLEAFTRLYENWPMKPSYREHAWLTLKAVVQPTKRKSKSKTITTILEVQETRPGKRCWVVTKCDNAPEMVGTLTVNSVPSMAEMMPLGSTYTCTLKINHV